MAYYKKFEEVIMPYHSVSYGPSRILKKKKEVKVVFQRQETFFFSDELGHPIKFEFTKYSKTEFDSSRKIVRSDLMLSPKKSSFPPDKDYLQPMIIVNNLSPTTSERKKSAQIKFNIKDLIEIQIDSKKYVIEELKNIRYKRQTVAPSNDLLVNKFASQGLQLERQGSLIGDAILSNASSFVPRANSRRSIDNFKYTGRLMTTNQEKSHIMSQLMHSHFHGVDLFVKSKSRRETPDLMRKLSEIYLLCHFNV